MERIEVSTQEVAELLERIEPALGPEDFAFLEKIIQSFLHVTQLLEEKGTTIDRLKRLLFGSKSEKLENLFPDAAEAKATEAKPGEAASGTRGEEPGDGANDKRDERAKEKEKAKGHGRNGAEEYTGAEHIHIPHPSLKPGEPCPELGCKGKVYQFEPLVLVRVVGQAPLGAKVLTIAQLRCNLCLKVFCGCDPEKFGSQKYDESAAAMIAVLTYGTGVPFYRLGGLQENLGIPLPASTQWDMVHRAAKLVAPAFEELIRQAAQGDVLHNDDTPMKILEYMKRKERRENGG